MGKAIAELKNLWIGHLVIEFVERLSSCWSFRARSSFQMHLKNGAISATSFVRALPLKILDSGVATPSRLNTTHKTDKMSLDSEGCALPSCHNNLGNEQIQPTARRASGSAP